MRPGHTYTIDNYQYKIVLERTRKTRDKKSIFSSCDNNNILDRRNTWFNGTAEQELKSL
jgi:hypothetical protein